MSTVKAINLQHPNSSNINMVLGADGSVSGGLPSPNRNLLYNGAMQVAQRATSASSITTQSFYTADRWLTGIGTCGTWTQSVENDGPTGSGFRKSLKMLVTTAKSSLSSGDRVWMIQQLEGQDIQRVAKGTSSAQQLTLSFWAKSNLTGTYTILMFDNDNSRSVSASYTIVASGVWEKKVITFPADTTGVWDNDNNASIGLYFTLATGTAMTSGTLNTVWGADVEANRCVGQVNLAASVNNYWQITGVQLEVGPAPTPFEFKPYGQELRDCQRYYFRMGGDAVYERFGYGLGNSSTVAVLDVRAPVTMRIPPLAPEYSNIGIYDGNTVFAVTLTMNTASKNIMTLNATGSGLTAYRPYQLHANNSNSAYLAFSAEL